MTHQPENTPPVCSYEGSDYQQSFWEEGNRQYEDLVEAIALRRLLHQTGNLLLELGAGAGRNTHRYKNFKKVVLLDYSRTQLIQARQRLGGSDLYVFVAADVYKLPFVSGLFDSATMIRTLHHMAEPGLALNGIRRVLAADALFILEFANKRNLKSVLRYLTGKQDWSPFAPEQVEFAALNFDFHPKTIRKLLKDNGFALKNQLTVSHFRIGWLKRHIPISLLVFFDSVLQWTGPLIQYSPSVFTLSKTTGTSPKPAHEEFFACPICQHSLPETAQTLICPGCGHEWTYQDGIYEFRINPEYA